MAKSVLEVIKRTRVGKGGARQARREGMIPAVLYGMGSEPVAISVDPAKLKTALATEAGDNTLLDIKIENEKGDDTCLALVKDVQYDFLTSQPIHFDFYKIDMVRKITLSVPFNIVGKSIGITQGGLLEQIIREVEIECLPTAIPNNITIDITELDLGNSIHLGDLEMPEGAVATHDPHETILTIVSPSALIAETEEEVEEEGVGEGKEETTEAEVTEEKSSG